MASFLKRIPSFRRSISAASLSAAEDPPTGEPFDIQWYLSALEAAELRQILLNLSSEHTVVRDVLEKRSKDRPIAVTRQPSTSYGSKKRRAEAELERDDAVQEVSELGQKKLQDVTTEESVQTSSEEAVLVQQVNEEQVAPSSSETKKDVESDGKKEDADKEVA